MNRAHVFTLKNVSFRYGNSEILHGLDTVFTKGLFYGILGPNGCGKTTLIDLLCGIRSPISGEILFYGKPLNQWNRRELARKIALVPQEFDTNFGFTVEEIVHMGRHPHIGRFGSPTPDDWSAVEQAMQDIGITDLRHRRLSSLSGGQKQRAVVARALAQDGEVLLLDEATANLDIRYTLHIFRQVRQMVTRQSRTAIGVIHDLNLACAFCDRILFLLDGRIISSGPVLEVMTPDRIRDVFGVEVEVEIRQGVPRVHYQHQPAGEVYGM